MSTVTKLHIKYVIALLLLVSAGCSNLLQKPELVSIENPKISEIVKDKINFSTDIVIYNPNWFTLSANDINYNIYFDSLLLGRGSINGEMTLDKEKFTQINNSISIFKYSIKELVESTDTVSVDLVGSLTVPYLNFKYYYNLDYKLDVKKILDSITKSLLGEIKVEIDEIVVKSFDIRTTDLLIDFKIDSDIEFDYKLKKLSVQIYKEGNERILGSSEISNEYLIKSNSINKFQSDVQINNIKMGSALLSNILDNDLTLSLEINSLVEYSDILLPVKTNRKIKFNVISRKIELI